MTAFPTCKNCVLEKQPCERRNGVRLTIKGLGITSAKLKCPDRAPLYVPGQRVSVTWPVADADDEYHNHTTLESWPATVVKEVRSRFVVKVDDILSDYETLASEFIKNPTLYAKVAVARLKPLDEPLQTVCAQCGRVGDGGYGEDGCYGQPEAYGYTPQGCASRQPVSEAAAQVSDEGSRAEILPDPTPVERQTAESEA